MKVNCPECKHKFDVETNIIRICYKEIAKNRAEEIKSFWNKNDRLRENTYNKIFEYVKNDWIIGEKKSTQDILYLLELNEYSKGDFLRIILDNMVCKGWLKKKFMRGKKGHIYTKIQRESDCQFWLDSNNWCRLYFNSEGKPNKDKSLLFDYSSIIKKYEKEEE